MNVKKGFIERIKIVPGSNLGTVVISTASRTYPILCDADATIKAFEMAFGKDSEKYLGEEIYFTTDLMGILDGFTPVRDATDELIKLVSS